MLPIAAGALASAVVIPAVAAQSELSALIETHRAAEKAFGELIDALEKVERAFRDQEAEREPVAIPCFEGTLPYLGGIVSFEQSRNHIENAYEFFCGAIEGMRGRDPRKAGRMLAEYKLTKDANLEALDAAVKAYEERKAAAGGTALEEARDTASEAGTRALFALCSCECRTLADVRLKASYLLDYYDGYNLEEEDVTALLQSLAGGQSNA
jgi:hypothetical protein